MITGINSEDRLFKEAFAARDLLLPRLMSGEMAV